MTINRIGITGAAGNIGRTLTDGLKESFQLDLFDRIAMTNSEHSANVVNLSNKNELSGKFNGLDALIHLAGNPSPSAPESDTMLNNFVATSLVFEEAKRAGVKKIIFASSNFYHEGHISEMMMGKRKKRITLSTMATPQSMYGKSKQFGEQIGLHLSYFGVSFAAIRIGWTVPQDSPLPYDSPYMRAMFCSKRDLTQAFTRALSSEQSFITGYAISNNDTRLFDLTETNEKLGFYPVDNSAEY